MEKKEKKNIFKNKKKIKVSNLQCYQRNNKRNKRMMIFRFYRKKIIEFLFNFSF